MTRAENFVKIRIRNRTMRIGNISRLGIANLKEVVSNKCACTQEEVDSAQKPHTSPAVLDNMRVNTGPRPNFRQESSFAGRDVRNLLRSRSGGKYVAKSCPHCYTEVSAFRSDRSRRSPIVK